MWWLRLSAPPGTGPDSVRFEFGMKLSRPGLPATGSYAVADGGVSLDTFRVDLIRSPDAPDGGRSYVGRSGELTLTEVAEGEVMAGRLEFSATPFDAPGDTAIEVSGSFRSGR